MSNLEVSTAAISLAGQDDAVNVNKNSEPENKGVDTGLKALVLVAQFHQLPVDAKQLQRNFITPGEKMTASEILRACKTFGLKTRSIQTSVDQISSAGLPAIAQGHDGTFFVIAKVEELANKAQGVESNDSIKKSKKTIERRFLIFDTQQKKPSVLTEETLNQSFNGELILVTYRKSLVEQAQEKFDIRWFIPSIIKYKKLFRSVIIASFFLQLFALVTPFFFQVVMDKVLVHKGFTTLDVLAVGFFIVAGFEAVLGGIRNYVFSHTTNRIDVELGARLYQHLMRLPLAYFTARQVGQTVARVRELDTIRNFITGTALTLVIDLFFTIVFLIVMWFYSKQLTYVVLACLPFYIILSVFITPILRHRLDEKFKYGAENQAFLTESIGGMETVKSMAVEPNMQRKWEGQISNYVHASFRSQNLSNIANQCASFINKMMTLGIIWYGAHLVMAGELTVGQLVAFNMLAGRVSGPILKLVQLWQDFQQAGISIKRLGDILNSPTEPGYNPNRSTLPKIAGEISFDQVRFRYRADGPVIIEDFTASFSAGKVVGIVGRSGSGKSTLTKLIQRLYVPEAGTIKIDGLDLAIADTGWLRQHIGVVLQENFLFNQTVRENIALVNPATPMEQVMMAAKLSGAHEFISELPEGYDTMVGEQGSNLSGGQRQRLAIARALLTNPRILIFDEATSALDYESERIIQDNMVDICKGRTVFIIAHRLSTVRLCDEILVMDKGRMVERGDHDTLIKSGGYYHKLHSYQSVVPVSPSSTDTTGTEVSR